MQFYKIKIFGNETKLWMIGDLVKSKIYSASIDDSSYIQNTSHEKPSNVEKCYIKN